MPFAIPATMRAYTVALCLEKAWIVRLACDGCDREQPGNAKVHVILPDGGSGSRFRSMLINLIRGGNGVNRAR